MPNPTILQIISLIWASLFFSLLAGLPFTLLFYRNRTVFFPELLIHAFATSVGLIVTLLFIEGVLVRFFYPSVYLVSIVGYAWVGRLAAKKQFQLHIAFRDKAARWTYPLSMGLILFFFVLYLTTLFSAFFHYDAIIFLAYQGKNFFNLGYIPEIFGPASTEFSIAGFSSVFTTHAWFRYHFNHDMAIKIISPLTAGFFALCTYLLGRELSPRWGGFGAVAILFSYSLFEYQAITLNQNIAYGFFVTASFYFYLIFLKDQKRLHNLVFSGLLLGVGFGFKYLVLLHAAFVFGHLIYLHRKDPKIWFLFVISCLIPALPIIIRSWVVLGNPIYPYLFGGKGLEDWVWKPFFNFFTGAQQRSLKVAWTDFMSQLFSYRFEIRWGILVWFLSPFCYGLITSKARKKNIKIDGRPWITISMIFVFYLVYELFVVSNINHTRRYFIGVYGLMASLTVPVIKGFGNLLGLNRPGRKGFGLKISFILILITIAGIFPYAIQWKHFLKLYQAPLKETYLASRSKDMDYGLHKFLSSQPDVGKLLLFSDRTYYLNRPWIIADMREMLFLYQEQLSIEKALDLLREKGITHIVFRSFSVQVHPFYNKKHCVLFRYFEDPTYFSRVYKDNVNMVYSIKPAKPDNSG